MKKILISLILFLAAALCLTACNNSYTADPGGDGGIDEMPCEHTHVEYTPIREQTCQQTGIYRGVCADCGKDMGTVEDETPREHSYTEFVSHEEKTCQSPDVDVYACSNMLPDGSVCGETVSYYGEVLGEHSYEYDELYLYSMCSLCNRPSMNEDVEIYENDMLFYRESDGDISLSYCFLPEATTITIPEKISTGEPVVGIAYEAFSCCTQLTELIIPEGEIYYIPLEIIEGFSAITEYENGRYYPAGDNPYFYFLGVIDKEVAAPFTLHPDTVSIVGNGFYGSDITSVELPAGIRYIDSTAFAYTSNLTSLVIPEGVKAISSKTFEGSKITSVTLPESVKSIGYKAFSYSEIESIDLSNVTDISEGAFQGCYALKSAILSDELTYLTWDVFLYCPNLSVDIPESVTDFTSRCLLDVKEITVTLEQFLSDTYELAGARIINIKGEGVFPTGAITEAYTLIEEINFGDGITRVMPYSITNLPNLKKIGFGKGISHLEARCFWKCDLVDTIVFSENMREIDSEVFSKTYTNGFTTTTENGLSFIGNGTNPYFRLYGASGATGEVVIPEGVVVMSIGVLSPNSKITSVTLPDSLLFVEGNSFPEGGRYTEIGGDRYVGSATNPYMILISVDKNKSGAYTVAPGVRFIMSYAFNGTGITSVEMGEGVRQVKEYGFGGSSTNTVVLPSQLGSVGRPPMGDLVGNEIGEVNAIPGGLLYIPQGALLSLPADATYINEGTYFIGKNAFAEGTAFTSYGGALYIGTKTNPYYALVKIESNAASVTIHESTVLIAQYAFSGATNMSSVTIPDSVLYINAFAFYGIKGLESVEIGSGVLEIGYSAFGGCTELESVKMSYGVRIIESQAFAGCTALRSIYIPSSVMVCGSYISSCTVIYCQAVGSEGTPYFDEDWNKSWENFNVINTIWGQSPEE